MIVIICIDEKNGLMFNNRRQSQDRNLRNILLREIGKRKLWMNEYSFKQFNETGQSSQICVCEDFLQKAKKNEFCFVENSDITPFLFYIEGIILFKWNRNYPADVYFKTDISAWDFIKSLDFIGSSHDKITMEVYLKK